MGNSNEYLQCTFAQKWQNTSAYSCIHSPEYSFRPASTNDSVQSFLEWYSMGISDRESILKVLGQKFLPKLKLIHGTTVCVHHVFFPAPLNGLGAG